MMHLWYANSMEALVARLVQTLRPRPTEGAADPLAPTHIIVPNRQLAAFLTFAIARQTGIAAHLACHFLHRFLADLLPSTPGDVRVLEPPALHSLLLGLLEDDDYLRQPVLQPLRDYLHAAGTQAETMDRRRFQVAAQLAHLFEEYSLSRAAMLRAWAADCTLGHGPYAATEAWQRHLWLSIFGEGGTLHRLARESGTTWLPLAELGDRLPVERLAVPPRLHVFGLSYVAPVFHTILAHLAQVSELHLYTLHPCLEFQEDTVEGGVAPAAYARHLPGRQAAASLDLDADTLPLEAADDPLPLRLWGRPGRENLHLLLARTACQATSLFVDPTAPGRTLLRQLQRHILRRQPAPTAADPALAADESLCLLACPGVRREVEIVANEIWALLAQDESPATHPQRLRFHDLAVIVPPQARDVYLPQIAAVFTECHHIPYTIIDMPVTAESRFLEAVELLLALPCSRFTRQDLLGLLLHPALVSRVAAAERQEWLWWCEELGILHGADHQAHADTYIEPDLFNWDQGLRRLVLGGFMSGERSGDQRAFTLNGSTYLPLEYGADRLPSAASFILLVRSLIADARYCQTTRLPLSQWAVFLGHLLTAYLQTPPGEDERYRSRALEVVQGLADLDLDGRPVSYRIAYEFVRSGLTALESQHSGDLAHGVVVSSFLPMRPLPFRVVFVVGLDEGAFPAADHDNPLDLRRARRQVGDVGSRERDLYMFLETLVSTRDRLVLSYVCQDPHTGEERQPASVLQELLYILEQGYLPRPATAARIVRHPLRRYDGWYFPAGAGTPAAGTRNVLPAAGREAMARGLHDDLQRFCREHGLPFPDLAMLRTALPPAEWERLRAFLGQISPPPAPPRQPDGPLTLSLPLLALRRFLACPLQGWARFCLGLHEETDTDLLDREDEPLAVSRLVTTRLLRQVMVEWLAHDGKAPVSLEGLYDARAARLQLAGRLPTGVFFEAERHKHLKTLGAWYDNLQQAGLAAWQDPCCLRFGGATGEAAGREEVRAPLVFDLVLANGRGPAPSVRVEVHGRTETLSPSLPGSLTLVARKEAHDADFLAGFLDYVVLSLAPRPLTAPYQVLVNTDETLRLKRFHPLDREEAAVYLRDLLSDLLGRTHAYLLPVEVIGTYQQQGRSLSTAITDLLDNERAHCSSRYGPIGHLHRFAPPPEAEARQMLQRRFGLFFARQEEATP